MIQQKKDIGIISTVIFHIIVLLLLFLFGFKTYYPLPDEEGIEVNFGDSPFGSGNIEPSVSYRPVQQTNPISESSPQSSATQKEEVMTQDFEETAVIEEKKRKEQQQKILDEQQKKQREAEETERKRQEEIERQRRAEEQRKIEEAQKLAGVFGQSQNNSNSQGQGTGGTGNQGDPSGNPNSGNQGSGQGQGSSGGGLGREGISFSLEGRKSVELPRPSYPGNEEGDVVITVTVDQNGNVTRATPGGRGSTTTNQALVNAALEAAKKAKFNKDEKSAVQQQGTITYRFKRN